jgi:hypothetical protein
MNLTALLATALFGLAIGAVTLMMISDDSLTCKATGKYQSRGGPNVQFATTAVAA